MKKSLFYGPGLLALAITLFSISNFAVADSPETRRFIGIFRDQANIDADVVYDGGEISNGFKEFNNVDGTIDGDLRVTLRVDKWVSTDDPGVYRAVGTIDLFGILTAKNPNAFQIADKIIRENTYGDGTNEIQFNNTTNRLLLDLNEGEIAAPIPLTVDNLGTLNIKFDADEEELDGRIVFDFLSFAGNVEVDGKDNVSMDLKRLGGDFDIQPSGPFLIDSAPNVEGTETADGEYQFDFLHNDEEWDFKGIDGYTNGGGRHDKKDREMRINVNANNQFFGMLEGPKMRQNDSELFRFRYRIDSNIDTPAEMPTLRMRSMREDFQFSAEHVIAPVGPATVSPSDIDDREFDHFVRFPRTDNVFRNFLDAYNLSGRGATSGKVTLPNLEIISTSDSPRRAEGGFEFGDDPSTSDLTEFDARGFMTGFPNDGVYGAPNFEVTEIGLQITPRSFGDQIGYWERRTGIIMEPGRVYRARFRITTGAASQQGRVLPTIRGRMNDLSFQTASLGVLVSTEDDSIAPIDRNEDGAFNDFFDMDVYLALPEQAGPQELLLAFDCIYIISEGNEPIPVVLDKVDVSSFGLIGDWPG